MQSAEPYDLDCSDHASGHPWWHMAPTLMGALQQQYPDVKSSASYRVGDADLRVDTDCAPLLDAFEVRYRDCAVAPEVSNPAVHCVVRRGSTPPMLWVHFLKGCPVDPVAAFLPRREMRVWDSQGSGWRLAGDAAEPMLAAYGPDVLMHCGRVWREFPVEYLVNVTLSSQPDLLAVHAASVVTSFGALLLAGPSHAGKSTTALHLAARGNVLLGDEVALLQPASNKVLPFHRTANLRQGPRGKELLAAIGRVPGDYEVTDEGELVRKLRIRDLFPHLQAKPEKVSAVFFLDGFSDQPALVPFEPTLDDMAGYGILAGNEIATLWSVAPARRALRLISLKHMLQSIPCWRLRVGPPNETCEVIERTMERSSC